MNHMQALVEKIVERYDYDAANLIMILQDLQAAFKYLPAEAITLVSEKLHVPKAEIYAVATFYKSFSLQPRGRHKIEICEGTACHIRGATILMNQASNKLGISAGETTADGEFTLESVHCVGACAMGPVVVIDGVYHGNLTAAKLTRKSKNAPDGKNVLALQMQICRRTIKIWPRLQTISILCRNSSSGRPASGRKNRWSNPASWFVAEPAA